MKKTRVASVAFALVALSAASFGQFGLGKVSLGQKSSNTPDVGQVLTQSTDLVKLITAATDQGVLAMDELGAAFPPEKVAAYKELSKKYHESQASRKDGNIDAEGAQIATDAAVEFAKLAQDWQSYRKDGTDHVSKADRRLGLMLLGDGLAATTLPPVVKSIQSTIESLAHNPLQAGKVTQLQWFAQLFAAIGPKLPKQVDSFRTVRSISKNIATAEKMTIPPDPPADSLKDAASFTNTYIALGD